MKSKNVFVKNIDVELLKKQQQWLIDKNVEEKDENAEGIINLIGSIIDKAEEDDGVYYIPSMCITRDDLKSRFEDSDNFEEKQKEIENISDEDMQFMADKMTDMMMEDFWYALDEAYYILQEKHERQEVKQK